MRFVNAKSAMSCMFLKVTGLPKTCRPSTRRAIMVANAAGCSSGVRTSTDTTSRPPTIAAAVVISCSPMASTGLVGFHSAASREVLGAISLISSRRLPTSSGSHVAEAGDVAAGAGERFHQADLLRKARVRHQDRNRAGSPLGGLCCRRARRDDRDPPSSGRARRQGRGSGRPCLRPSATRSSGRGHRRSQARAGHGESRPTAGPRCCRGCRSGESSPAAARRHGAA